MSNELEVRAKAIDIKCKEDIAEIRLKEPTSAFLSFIEELKAKISEDFKYINESFLTLLEHVKELEKTLKSEFGEKDRLKEIESFEMKVNTEVGSIVNSFNLYTTINEIKGAVVEKIKSIKRLVSLKKKEEIKRAQAAKENIKKLKKQINEAEKDASEMSKKVERFQTVALKDGLTGLYNRKAFDTRVKSALKGFNELEQPFSIVLFDVDKFKEINDTFGHVAGDTILKKVSQCLMETFRKNDFIARYGGDEFVVVIENLTREMADERILNFRKNLRKRRFTSYAKGDVSLTVSAGIALVEEGDTLESLIIRADKAMYASKKKKN
jgi:diguanylate cyclase